MYVTFGDSGISSKWREFVRLSLPHPCLNEGGCSSGSRYSSSIPVIAVAPLITIAFKSEPDGARFAPEPGNPPG